MKKRNKRLLAKNHKNTVIILIIVFEMLGILFIICRLFFITRQFIKKPSIIPVDKHAVVSPVSSSLIFFYENEKNKTVIEIMPWGKKQVEYSLNKDGLNSLEDYLPKKLESTFRIATLGDSFTFGQFVNTVDNWSVILQSLLNKKPICDKYNKFEVINFGVRDYDIQHALEEYKIKGRKYNPDLIIWFIKDDDFRRINEYFKPILEEIIKKKATNGSSALYFKDKGEYYHFWSVAENIFKNKYSESSVLAAQQLFIESIYKYFDGQLVLFTLNETDNKYKRIMINITKKHSSTFFNDSFRLYDRLDSYSLVFPDAHPNKAGHQKIAEYLFRYLKEGPLKNNCL